MGKTLRNLVIGSIMLAGSLLIPSCGVEKSVDDITKKTTQQTTQQSTGQGDAYDEALRIAQNPESIVTGNAVGEKSSTESYSTKEIPQTQLEPRTDRALIEEEKKTREIAKKPGKLEDSFLEEGEKYLFSKEEMRIGNLRLATMEELEGNIRWPVKRNPSVRHIWELTDEEREQMKKDMREDLIRKLFNIELAEKYAENLVGVVRGGTALYNFMGPREKNKWGGDVIISFQQFKSIQDIEDYILINNLTEWVGGDRPNFLAKDTIISIIPTQNYDEDNYLNYVKLLLNYQERVGAEPITNNEDLKGEKYAQVLRDYIDKNR